MNADIEELMGADAEMRRLVVSLRRAPQAHVAAGFAARVMAEVRAQRRHAWLSASTVFAVAASLIAVLSVGLIFSRPLPKPSLAKWAVPPFTVRLAPYNPADWYAPLAYDASVAAEMPAEEPLCTREALAARAVAGR